MTMRIRIENADTNTAHGVTIQVWDKGGAADGSADTLQYETSLNCPTCQIEEYTLWSLPGHQGGCEWLSTERSQS